MNFTEINHRLVVPLAQRGNTGKSTVMGVLGQWLSQRRATWRGADFDVDHKNLSALFPDEVDLCPVGAEPEGDILNVLRRCHMYPVFIGDPRAHLADRFLHAFGMVHFPEAFAREGGRITVMVFPAEDLEVLMDIDRTVSVLGDTVDYLMVKNRFRAPRLRMFESSDLEAELLAFGAQVLEVPVLLSLARNSLASLEAEMGRGVTHIEAVANKDLPVDPMVRLLIEDWLKGLFRRLDVLAPLLLPTSLLPLIPQAQASPETTKATVRGAKINRTNL